MLPVFGRTTPGTPHSCENALKNCLEHPVDEYQAIAVNLMYDARVSTEREKVFLDFAGPLRDAEELEEGLKKYFLTKIRNQKKPHYDHKDNSNNFLTNLPIADDLIRLLDLNMLGPVFSWARGRFGSSPFSSFPKLLTEETIREWLDGQLKLDSQQKEVPRSKQREFVNSVLDMLTFHQKEVGPFNPAWVTTWAAFAPYREENPERWGHVVGVENRPSHWIIVLKYRKDQDTHLVRPTQLDAGWSPHHFPSPPQAWCGHPMDLHISSPVTVLLPEYIHSQIPYSHEYLWDWNRIEETASGSLRQQRKAPYQLLSTVYAPEEIQAWMPQPMPIP
ncbi:MAG: hypothetical protein EXR78_07325 [Deltaproteobacteria bacterium]|nr:hypothetical protein [Deltaproteobacteria bacterium]